MIAKPRWAGSSTASGQRDTEEIKIAYRIVRDAKVQRVISRRATHAKADIYTVSGGWHDA